MQQQQQQQNSNPCLNKDGLHSNFLAEGAQQFSDNYIASFTDIGQNDNTSSTSTSSISHPVTKSTLFVSKKRKLNDIKIEKVKVISNKNILVDNVCEGLSDAYSTIKTAYQTFYILCILSLADYMYYKHNSEYNEILESNVILDEAKLKKSSPKVVEGTLVLVIKSLYSANNRVLKLNLKDGEVSKNILKIKNVIVSCLPNENNSKDDIYETEDPIGDLQ
jgi:hypothetical protein